MKKSVGAGVSGAELDARRQARVGVAAELKSGRMALLVIRAVECATDVAATATDAAKARQPPPASACREGCAWCCYKVVGVAAAEVVRIAGYLNGQYPAEVLAALRERLEATGRSRNRAPCPLLTDDRCMAYPVRPLTCRGFNSSDARRCEDAVQSGNFAAVPAYAPQQRLATLVLDGLRAGLQEVQLDGRLLDLAAALRLALADPDVGARWLAGKSAFAAAELR